MTANSHAGFDPGAAHDRLLPWRAVKDMTGISRTTAWRLQNTGGFPRPVVISPGRVGWRESDVAAWKAALTPRGARLEPGQPKLFDPPQVEARPKPAARRRRTGGEPIPAAKDPQTVKSRSRRPSTVASNQMSFDF